MIEHSVWIMQVYLFSNVRVLNYIVKFHSQVFTFSQYITEHCHVMNTPQHCSVYNRAKQYSREEAVFNKLFSARLNTCYTVLHSCTNLPTYIAMNIYTVA